MQEASNWIIEETKSIDLGDKRLNKRYAEILNSFSSKPNHSVPAACNGWAETMGAYRFLNHKGVTPSKILSPHQEATLTRIRNERVVLIPQDTTEIDFSGRKSLTGMGYLGAEHSLGSYVHASFAITPERVPLGTVDLHLWTRDILGIKGTRRKRPIEEKEAYCWIKSYEACNKIALAVPNTAIITIADRGGDIYELLEKLPSETNKAYWLVRSNQDRMLVDEKNKKLEFNLREAVENTKSLGTIEFTLSEGMIYARNKKRTPRTPRPIQQEVRACSLILKAPSRSGKKLEPIRINVIHCVEINAPNEEEKIEWFLLTSYPVTDAIEAIQIVKWYLCRWEIELFFKVLKSGCAIEELQFDTFKGISNCLAFYMIVAWRIMYLTMLGRQCPDLDCSVVFERSEWQSLYAIAKKTSPPKIPPTLNEIILMIGKLGGFLGRKSDRYPGYQAMWIGIQRMRDFAIAWETFRGL